MFAVIYIDFVDVRCAFYHGEAENIEKHGGFTTEALECISAENTEEASLLCSARLSVRAKPGTRVGHTCAGRPNVSTGST
ncbi:MAG: hypothetical protein JWO44_513 [Bacteroidetes bacterium]|nr:hypothetical protein [Bacteroidota bacterium]